jgi:hypothetical protein
MENINLFIIMGKIIFFTKGNCLDNFKRAAGDQTENRTGTGLTEQPKNRKKPS